MRLALAILVLTARLAAADPLLDALATDDPTALAAAVTAIERAPTTPELADTLFAAARACEDRLLDPARALRLYDRLQRELPDARVSAAAEKRATRLRASVGAGGEHAREAEELAHLIANADTLAPDAIITRTSALAAARWPGAPDAALWLAEYLRRLKRFDEAQARYADVVARWPGSPHAASALRGGTGNAIDAGDWTTAEHLLAALPANAPDERILRDDLRAAITSGRLRARLYLASWLAALLAIAALLASLADAILRGGRRLPSPRPPIEVWFILPLGTLVLAIAYLARPAIAPTVAAITATGLTLAWLSGVTLDLLRVRGRAVRVRSMVHAVAIAIAVVGVGYVSITRNELMDLLVETIRSGPEG